MKAKKLVSLLLAVMLVIGMLPISALAADVAIGTATGNDCVDISLSVSTSFGLSGDDFTSEDDLVVSSIDDYKTLTGEDINDHFKRNAGIDTVGRIMDSFYDASKSSLGASDNVGIGSTVYVGFKTQLKKANTYKGVYSATIKMYYNKTQIESLNGDTDIGNPGTTPFLGTIAVNGASKISGSRFEKKNDAAGNTADRRAWAGDFALDGNAVSLTDIGNNMVEMTIKYGGTNYYFPTDTTWDVVVPMKIKKAGTIDLKLDPTLNSAFEGVGVSDVDNGGSLINGFFEMTTDSTGINFFTHSASITVVSNEASMEVSSGGKVPAGAASATVNVAATGATIKAAADGTNWSFIDKNNGNASVGTVSAVTSAGAVTITGVTSTPGTYTLKATKDAVTANGKTVPDGGFEMDVEVIEAVTDSVVGWHATNGLTLTAAAGKPLLYKAGATGTWTEIAGGGNKNWKPNELVTLIGNNTGTPDSTTGITTYTGLISVGLKPATGNTPDYSIDVPIQRYTKPSKGTVVVKDTTATSAENGKVAINTKSENVYVGTGLMSDITGSDAAGNGSTATNITSALDGSGFSGKHVWIAANSDGTVLASEKEGLDTLTRPNAPTVSKGTTDPTDLQNHKTTYSYAGTVGDLEVKVGAAAWTPVTSLTIEGATTATDVQFRTKATDSAFASKPTTAAKGDGYVGGTVSITSPEKGATELVLTIVGDKWVADPAGSITINKPGSGTVSATTKSISIDKYTLTLTVPALDDEGDYTVSIAAGAVEGNVAPHNNASLGFTISDKGYTLTINNATHATDGVATGITKLAFSKTSGIQPGDVITISLKTGESLNAWETLTADGIVIKNGSTTLSGVALDNDTLKWTVPGSGTINTKTELTVDVTTAVKQMTLTKDNNLKLEDITSWTKDYDGDATFDTATNGTVALKNLYSGTGAPDPVTISATLSYDDKNAGTGKTVNATGITLSATSAYYKLGDDLKGTVALSTDGVISQAAVTSVEATAATAKATNVTKSNVLSKITEAMKNATVSINDSETAKLSAILDSSTDWEALAAKFIPLAGNEIDASATTTVDVKPGDYIVSATDISTTGLVAGEDNKYYFTADISAGDTITVGDATLTIGEVGEAVLATDSLVGKSVNVSISKGDIGTNAITTGNFDFSSFGTGSEADDEAVAFTLNLKKKDDTTPAPTTSVVVEPTGYGPSIDVSNVTVDEDGHIQGLPAISEVTAVKGAAFRGWADSTGKIINPETYVVPEGETVELTAVYSGYMNGYGDGSIRPQNYVTRGELLKMLLTAMGEYNPYDLDADYGTTKFEDARGKWYEDVLACAEKKGLTIVGGRTDGRFDGDAQVKRSEASKMIAKAFGVQEVENPSVPSLSDFDELPDWAKGFVAALYANETIGGRADGTFDGEAPLKRSEAAKMINRYLGLMLKIDRDAIAADTNYVSPFKDVTDKTSQAYPEMMFASLNANPKYYNEDIEIPPAVR